jgi:hypothetical protein
VRQLQEQEAERQRKAVEQEAERARKAAEQEAKIRQQFRADLEKKERDRQNFGSGVNPFFQQQFQAKSASSIYLTDTQDADISVEVFLFLTIHADLY